MAASHMTPEKVWHKHYSASHKGGQVKDMMCHAKAVMVDIHNDTQHHALKLPAACVIWSVCVGNVHLSVQSSSCRVEARVLRGIDADNQSGRVAHLHWWMRLQWPP